MAALIYILNSVALIAAFAIVKLTPALIGISLAIIAFGFALFGFLSYLGNRLMLGIVEDGEEPNPEPVARYIPKTEGYGNEACVISDERLGESSNVDATADEENAKNSATVVINRCTSTTHL